MSRPVDSSRGESVEERDREARRSAYERVLGTVEKNTGYKQPEIMNLHSFYTTVVSHGSLSHEEAELAYQAARENGDLLRVKDGEGEYALCRCDADSLREAAAYLGEMDDTPTDSLGKINKRLSEVRE